MLTGLLLLVAGGLIWILTSLIPTPVATGTWKVSLATAMFAGMRVAIAAGVVMYLMGFASMIAYEANIGWPRTFGYLCVLVGFPLLSLAVVRHVQLRKRYKERLIGVDLYLRKLNLWTPIFFAGLILLCGGGMVLVASYLLPLSR